MFLPNSYNIGLFYLSKGKPGSKKNPGWVKENCNLSSQNACKRSLVVVSQLSGVYLVQLYLLFDLGATHVQVLEALHIALWRCAHIPRSGAKMRNQTFHKAPKRQVWMSVSGTWELIWLSNPEETRGIWLRLKDLHVVATNKTPLHSSPGYK